MKTKSTFFSTKKIAYTAVFIAVSIALNTLTFVMGATAISFTYVPCVLAGIFLGPISGLLVGALGDILGVIISPKGAYIPLITIGSAMMGFIPGLVAKIPKLKPQIAIAISYLLIFLVTTVTLNTLGLYYIYGVGKKTFWVYLIGRLPKQTVILSLNIFLTYFIYAPLKKIVFDKMYQRKPDVFIKEANKTNNPETISNELNSEKES